MSVVVKKAVNDWLLQDVGGKELLLSEVTTGAQLDSLYEYVEDGDSVPREVLDVIYELAMKFGPEEAYSMWFTIGGFVEVFAPEQQANIRITGKEWLREA